MLRELKVKDYAIIDEASIEFDSGFNVMTGETGAGKSILVEALGLALGERSSEEMIKTGADKAIVEAVFDLSKTDNAKLWLDDQGFSDESGDLLIRRIISRNGRNKTFINGGMATVSQVKQLGGLLVDTHGQHESQSLFNVKAHLPFLDRFLNLDDEREDYRETFDKYQGVKNKLKELNDDQKETERKIDLLKFQTTEIAEAYLQAGEEKQLETDKQRLSHAEKLLELTAETVDTLDDGDNSAQSKIGKGSLTLSKMAELDASLTKISGSLSGALIQLEDVVGELRGYASSLEHDPAKLAQVDDRLDLIRNLKRKYGDTIDDILEYKIRAEKELEAIEFDREHIDALEAEAEKLGVSAAKMALALDTKRVEGAKKFGNAVEKQLKDLNMEKTRIEPTFNYDESEPSPCVKEGQTVALHKDGIGRMEILFSSNPGEPVKPLNRIASGGEISRLMLALKTALTGKQPTPVIIFDEIDTGIGGATGDRLGEKMRALAQKSQVFCVTHLAQVATQANAQFLVEKSVKRGKTAVVVEKLAKEGRVRELARMAGGEKATESALKWAEEALNSAS